MTEELFTSPMNFMPTQMLQNNSEIGQGTDNTSLSSLALEVDDIFFSLRKADQIIRREINAIKKNKSFKKSLISSIDENRLKKIINQLPPYQILVDEYIIYMLENHNNSIFVVIKEYNEYLEKRIIELEKNQTNVLISIDEKLVNYIRQLGAMTYHLNIHLNLLTVLLKNSPVVTETQEVVIKYMVNEWGEKQQSIKFIEVTIDGLYAIVTWTVEDRRGDAILQNNEGYWQLMNISAGMFRIRDFDNVDVPLDIAQRMLRLHHQKLGY